MGILASLALIVCGALAAANLIVQKQPNAKEVLDKLAPAQGWIGLIVGFWGVWIVIHAILNLGWLTAAPIWWLTYLLTGLLSFALGFLLGYPLLSQFILNKNAGAAQQGAALRDKLSAYQTPLGLAGIGLGLWCLIAYFLLL